MAKIFRVKAHTVEVARVVTVHPLVAHGAMMSPSAGLVLILDNGTRHNWILERDGVNPAVGDTLVHDAVLNLHYVVPVAKFAELFAEEQPQ
ncbi:MAG: hypothetical protein LAO08_18460 [Acidobacteriia bacterium]|nr:hypothetical protein [Terriglobia bacterium]